MKRSTTENRWGVLVLLALGLMISFVDRTSLSAALADRHFIREFALTNVERGWLNSAVFWSTVSYRSRWAGWSTAMA
ncbi:hypothetical protein [Paraburkholderia sp.]|uniref:hypothetical protein n=1 Tax=Paraburkholderia sp. TaxID=1926495 RepID=UPI0039E67A59